MVVNSEARERVLRAAERLFAEHGYTSVKLKDIALAANVRHATLYHHAPGGKEQLYIEVMENSLNTHRAGLNGLIAQHQGNLRDQLRAAADWLLGHPPLDLLRVARTDLTEIDSVQATRLSTLSLEAMIEPIALALSQAVDRGELGSIDIGLAAGGIFGMLQSMHLVPAAGYIKPRIDMTYDLIDMLLSGLLKRP